MSRRRCVWFVIASCACGFACAAEAWPRWRGAEAAGDGGDAVFPHEWADDAWVWTADLPGVGHASPVVWDGRVYTAAADEQGRTRFVMCHRLADGEREWLREIGGPIDPHHVQNSSASGSVAAGSQGVYWMWAACDGLRVEAFTHAGEPLWHVDLGPFVGEHGFGATPAVCGDLVIVPNDQDGTSFVVGLDAATGRERWRLPRESQKAGYATPLVIAAEAGPVVVLTSMAHGFTGVEPRTGRVLWEQAAFPKRTVSSPVRVGPLVIGTCGEGGGDNTLVAVQRPEAGGGPPTVVYQLDRSVAPYVPTPLAVAGRLYLWGDRGVVTCVDAATGATQWRGRVGGSFSASPIRAGDTVINVAADGEVVTIRAGDAFEVLGRRPLGEECRATPAVVGRRIVFRTAGRLLALDAK